MPQRLQALFSTGWLTLLPGSLLSVLGLLQVDSNPAGAIKDIMEGLALVAGVIGAAYVLRSKVKDLEDWRDEQDDRTQKIESLTIELAALSKANTARLERLERNEDEDNREKRRARRT
jgi:hypothetical protein